MTLTPQQRRVLTSLMKGKSNPEIALELGVTIDTVKAHMSHIFKRVNVHSRTQLVARHLKESLL